MRRSMLDSQNTPSVQTPSLKGQPARQFVDTPPSSFRCPSQAPLSSPSWCRPSTVSVIATLGLLHAKHVSLEGKAFRKRKGRRVSAHCQLSMYDAVVVLSDPFALGSARSNHSRRTSIGRCMECASVACNIQRAHGIIHATHHTACNISTNKHINVPRRTSIAAWRCACVSDASCGVSANARASTCCDRPSSGHTPCISPARTCMTERHRLGRAAGRTSSRIACPRARAHREPTVPCVRGTAQAGAGRCGI